SPAGRRCFAGTPARRPASISASTPGRPAPTSAAGTRACTSATPSGPASAVQASCALSAGRHRVARPGHAPPPGRLAGATNGRQADHIELADGQAARTVQIHNGTLVDLDPAGNVVGIEVIQPARTWPLDEILARFDVSDGDAQELRAYFEHPAQLVPPA